MCKPISRQHMTPRLRGLVVLCAGVHMLRQAPFALGLRRGPAILPQCVALFHVKAISCADLCVELRTYGASLQRTAEQLVMCNVVC